MELFSYEQTARSYYYMGQVSKVQFYTDRVLLGIVEDDDSVERCIAVKMF